MTPADQPASLTRMQIQTEARGAPRHKEPEHTTLSSLGRSGPSMGFDVNVESKSMVFIR